jgi:hypothetical protein
LQTLIEDCVKEDNIKSRIFQVGLEFLYEFYLWFSLSRACPWAGDKELVSTCEAAISDSEQY